MSAHSGNVEGTPAENSPGEGTSGDGMPVDRMVGFGSKQAWLAVRDADPAGLVAALALTDLGAVSWRSGVDLAYLTDDRLALTPPLHGAGDATWVLVTGRWLLSSKSTLDMLELSTVLDTEVQSFASYRVGEVHRWGRAVSGILVRSFAYIGELGEVTDWRGDPDETELAIGLPPALIDDAEVDGPVVLVSEADVMRVAGAWSIDPSELDGQPAPGPLRVASTPTDER